MRDEAAQSVLSKLLEEHGLSGESRLFREAERDSLVSTDNPRSYRLAANPTPSESVIDVYGPGYVVQAEQVGPGLAFAEAPSRDWQDSVVLRAVREADVTPLGNRVKVEVRIADILSQGGLVYPVESVEVERAWYFTLPTGSIEVHSVE